MTDRMWAPPTQRKAGVGAANVAAVPKHVKDLIEKILDIKQSLTGAIDPSFLSLCNDNGLLRRAAFPEAWAKIAQTAALKLGNVINESARQAKTKRQRICAIAKRIADASEKFAIASFAIGTYQRNVVAGSIGLVFLVVCLILTWSGAR